MNFRACLCQQSRQHVDMAVRQKMKIHTICRTNVALCPDPADINCRFGDTAADSNSAALVMLFTSSKT